MPVELSDKLLADAGGWREMKEARLIHAAGKVRDARYEDGILEGMVSHSGKDLKVRVGILSRSNFENACPCFRARREGIVCSHALAVGLEYLSPSEPAAEAREVGGKAKAKAPKRVPLSKEWPRLVEAGDEAALPTSLHIVLSPDLPGAWLKNRILVGIEARVGDERRMLASLKGEALYVDANDAALFRYLQEISPERVPSSMTISGGEFLRILGYLAGHSRVTLGRKERVEIACLPLRPRLGWEGKKMVASWPDGVTPMVEEGRAWALEGKVLYPVAPGLPSELTAIFEKGYEPDAAWLASRASRLEDWFEVDDAFLSAMPRIQSPEISLQLEGSLNHQEAKLFFTYGGVTVPATRRGAEFVKGGITDPVAEHEAIDSLEAFGFSEKSCGVWVLKDKPGILRFLAHGYPALPPRWNLSVGERFDHALGQVEPVEASFEFRGTGENWFNLDISFDTPSGEGVTAEEVRRLLIMGQESQRLRSGKIAVIDTAFVESIQETMADVDPRQDTSGVYTIDRSQAGYLRETAGAAGIRLEGESPWNPDYRFDELSDHLTEVLRPYQKEGVEWMLELAGRGMGGVLADDMGLGKTLQILSVIHTIGGSTLVVCPSSLVSNWMAEAEKFVPDLKAVAIEGPDRDSVYLENEDAGLFVTSYALLRRDESKWKERGEFTTVVLDEAQHIKNPDAKVSRAAHRLQSSYRFALTGTPVENSVRDLWSIFQFAVPGYLGNRAVFTERFEKPVMKGETAVRERLSRRLRPVILRRLKSEVARDLPDKIEQVVYCDLKPRQQAVYEQILRESRETVSGAEGGRRRMMALTALLRLRQTCCDLRLLGLDKIEPADASVKMDALEELLSEAIEGEHRVLVFSQFVEMLQVLVPMLGEKGIRFSYLDGSTRNRGDVVRQFQENDDIPVFLISLKAGGVGLNLTAADTVIHVDPWWNPAVEAQATDRAHRIGQTRVVTAYKLITRNTVEEKILALQNRKKETIKSLIDGQVDLGEGGLSDDELMELLEG